MNTIKRFFLPVTSNKKELAKFSFWWFLDSVYGIGSLFFVQKFISLIELQNYNQIIYLLIAFLLFNFVCIGILIKCNRWTFSDIYLHQLNWFATNYIRKFVYLDNTAVETLGTGKTISIISEGYKMWRQKSTDTIVNLISLGISISATIYIIYSFGMIYILVFFLLIIVFYFVAYFLNNFTLKYRKLRREYEIEYNRHLVKIIMSKFDILQNNKITEEVSRMKKINNNLYTTNVPVELFINLTAFLPSLILFICYSIFMIVITKSTVSFANIAIVFLVLSYLGTILNNSIFFFKDLTKEFVTIQKFWDFFDNTPEIKGINKGEKFKYLKGDFIVENLGFSYGEANIFSDFNINIKGGKITAFVGESGGGKSTLMKLLAGYIEANKGRIIIDGQDLNELNFLSYYEKIGYLTQEPNVFDGTILENLIYGATEEVSEKKLDEIIKLSRCEFIYDFKDGLKTEIGERGVRLSGGQKQRLAIAKIFIKNPDIVFLDEPTSALDSSSEKLIQESFANLFKGRTVVIIAHRLQTVKNADVIFVIQKGKVIESGNHESLIKQNGHYKEMLDLQSGF